MTQEYIDRLKEANDIVQVVGERLTLTRRGANYVGICPFHNDRTPSLTVSHTRQMYKCWACGAGGDVIKFIQEIDNLTFVEACTLLAKRAHMEPPTNQPQTPEEAAAARQREMLLNEAQTMQNTFSSARQQSAFVKFIAGRHISYETATKFGLGYATEGFFANRITYPFYSPSGQIVGFTGRAVDWNKECKYPKFKNSAESAIYHKEALLFGLMQAKHAICEMGAVYLVEGQHDVLSMYQFGARHTVCGSGTAFGEKQARLLHRYTDTVVIMYDGDEAGRRATLKTLRILLAEGLTVKIASLPDGDDPDTYAQRLGDKLIRQLVALTKPWLDYAIELYPYTTNADTYAANLRAVCELVACVPDRLKRRALISTVCEQYHIGANDVRPLIKPAPATDTWKDGFFGLDEAKELLGNDSHEGTLTFDYRYFVEHVDVEPVILYKGKPKKFAIQLLRKEFAQFTTNGNALEFAAAESLPMQVLATMHREGIKINIECYDEETETHTRRAFVDWYVEGNARLCASLESADRSECVRRSLDAIAYCESTMRTMNADRYAKLLDLKIGAYNELLKPMLVARKDKNELEKQRGDLEANLFDFDPSELPAYVGENEAMMKVYQNYGFYPLLKKDKTPCAYMFKNEKGNGHTRISDFYMTPLLHIYSTDDVNNKRVIQLSHIHFGDKFVEWPSSILANLGKVNEKLINAGAYNYTGSLNQFKLIWQQMSYNFTKCTELKVFGQQPEGFWAFTNAIYHTVDGQPRIDYVDELGVTTHEGVNYYSPAFSKIFLDERRDADQYEQDRYFVYKETPEADRITFSQWATLMNEVYKINDNGKFAILFDILACFRDFIYSEKKFFTTLFFIGPTGSGKSQIAYSMRALFMSPDAPVFNLNSGTDAAFFMTLERNRNVLAIMEEYNDANISQAKFQGLKSAILDGEGKIKVKDMATKTLDSSKINAIPLPLGQEAPQQDDGSLANRSILCDVPYKPKGEFTPEEVAIFDRLKEHERAGLSNVLIEILACRPVVKHYFIDTFNDEIKRIKAAVNANITNTEGLTRVTNSLTLLTTICRVVEERTELKLPFTYTEFFTLACEKIVRQMSTISVVNKLSNYFAAIGFLITQGSVKIGRELKVITPKMGEVTVKRAGQQTEIVRLPDPETKVLYIHFESIYPLYERVAGKSALSQQSLRAYFESHASYIGQCKSTKFTWYEETKVPRTITDADGKERTAVDIVMEKKQNLTSAYMFNYNTLVELADVDFERHTDEPAADDEDNAENLPF